MNTITPSLTPKVSRMSGASTPSVAALDVLDAGEQRAASTKVKLPPTAQALLQGQLLVADPGQEVVGEEDLLVRVRPPGARPRP